MTERQKDKKTILRQKKGRIQKDKKMIRQKAVIQTCEVDPFIQYVQKYILNANTQFTNLTTQWDGYT